MKKTLIKVTLLVALAMSMSGCILEDLLGGLGL